MSRSSLYSSIDRRINADAWFRGLSHDAQLLWFRILTGQHVTPVAGLWPARESGLADDFGFTLKQFRDLFSELAKDSASNGLPRVVADWRAGALWLPNAIRQECNQPSNWKMLLGWLKFLEMVPACEVKDRALNGFAVWLSEEGNRKRYCIEKGQPNPQLDRMCDGWRNGIRYSPHARDRAETSPGTKQNHHQEAPADSDRLTICPLDIVDRAHAGGVFSELAKALNQPEEALIEEARNFATYWLIGAGAGKKRAYWLAKLRQRLVERSAEGRLPKPEGADVILLDAEGRLG